VNQSFELKSVPSLPNEGILETQSKWLAAARSRLFRRVGIAHKRSILDLGAGYGHVSYELARRCNGLVFALDNVMVGISTIQRSRRNIPIQGDAFYLPFRDESLDLVFSQFSLLWMIPVENVLNECRRILKTGNHLIAIEPDFGGMIEFPPDSSLKGLWMRVLERNGAVSTLGRQLPGLLEDLNFEVTVLLLDRLERPTSDRFEFLVGLKLMPDEIRLLQYAKQRSAQNEGWRQIAHLPLFLIIAQKNT
jgi:SAM-dependent methyltransferase